MEFSRDIFSHSIYSEQINKFSVKRKLQISCPYGFVVPDDPSDDRIVWIPGTGCAVKCRTPIYTDKDFSYLDSMLLGLNIVSLPLCAILLTLWALTPELNSRIFIYYIGITLFIASCLNLSFNLNNINKNGNNSNSTNRLTCANNAVGRDYSDGATGQCTVMSFINIYSFVGSVIAWLLYFIDFYLQQSNRIEFIQKYFNDSIKIPLIIFTPFLWLILWGGFGLWGYPGGTNFCLISSKQLSKNKYDISILWSPLLLVCILSCICYSLILYSYKSNTVISKDKVYPLSIKSSSTATTTTSQTSLAYFQLIMPSIFLISFLTVFLFMIGYRFMLLSQNNSYLRNFSVWVSCVFFQYYTNNFSDEIWKSQCGEKPEGQAPLNATAMFYAGPNILLIIFSVIFIIGAITYKITGIDVGVLNRDYNGDKKELLKTQEVVCVPQA